MKKLSECMIWIISDTLDNSDCLLDTTRRICRLQTICCDAGAGELSGVVDGLPHPDLILVDAEQPRNRWSLVEWVTGGSYLAGVRVVVALNDTTTEDRLKVFRYGCADYLVKPYLEEELDSKLRRLLSGRLASLALEQQQQVVSEQVELRTKELREAQEGTIEAMACLAEYRDPESSGHIHRIKSYVRILANELRKNQKYKDALDDRTIDLMSNTAPLHDIGKIGIRSDILLKQGLLTPEEYDEMKLHTIIGHNALYIASKRIGENSFLKFAMELSKYHQEKWDGSGYPDGLIGELIPLSSRIMALADVYDALISKRPYKPPYTHQKAIELIVASKGTHFDPEIVDAFLKVEEKFWKISFEFSELDEPRQELTAFELFMSEK